MRYLYLFWVLAFVLVAIALYFYHRRQAQRILRQWTAEQGYELIRIEWPLLDRGPFPFVHITGQRVNRVVVRNREGFERAAWVCYVNSIPLIQKPELHWLRVVWEDKWDGKRRLVR